HDVVDHRKLAKQTKVLKRANDSVSGNMMRSQRGQILITEQRYFARARSKDASYDIDERALPRAIRTDQAVHASTPDRHVNPAQRANATKILRQSMHSQHRLLIDCSTREVEHTWVRGDRGVWAPPSLKERHLSQAANNALG